MIYYSRCVIFKENKRKIMKKAHALKTLVSIIMILFVCIIPMAEVIMPPMTVNASDKIIEYSTSRKRKLEYKYPSTAKAAKVPKKYFYTSGTYYSKGDEGDNTYGYYIKTIHSGSGPTIDCYVSDYIFWKYEPIVSIDLTNHGSNKNPDTIKSARIQCLGDTKKSNVKDMVGTVMGFSKVKLNAKLNTILNLALNRIAKELTETNTGLKLSVQGTNYEKYRVLKKIDAGATGKIKYKKKGAGVTIDDIGAKALCPLKTSYNL